MMRMKLMIKLILLLMKVMGDMIKVKNLLMKVMGDGIQENVFLIEKI